MSRKTVSKEARLTRASHQSASALGLFYRAADELEAAAQVAEGVAIEASEEARLLSILAEDATAQSVSNYANAGRIREFFVVSA